MAKTKNNQPAAKPAFGVPDQAHSIVPGGPPVAAAAAADAGKGGGRPTPVSAAPAGNENGRVETVHFVVRRVAIELPCAVAGEDMLGPRHLHASLSMNARRALKALVRGLDLAGERDRRNEPFRTPGSVNLLLERVWEAIHGGE